MANKKKPAKEFLTFKDIVGLGYVSNRVTLMRRVKAGDFPAPFKNGPRLVAWRATDIDAWIKRKMKERDIRPAALKPGLAHAIDEKGLELATVDLALIFEALVKAGYTAQHIARAIRAALTLAHQNYSLREAERGEGDNV
jgi:predicted DNA-binding transcriptional regulator AlpA